MLAIVFSGVHDNVTPPPPKTTPFISLRAIKTHATPCRHIPTPFPTHPGSVNSSATRIRQNFNGRPPKHSSSISPDTILTMIRFMKYTATTGIVSPRRVRIAAGSSMILVSACMRKQSGREGGRTEKRDKKRNRQIRHIKEKERESKNSRVGRDTQRKQREKEQKREQEKEQVKECV